MKIRRRYAVVLAVTATVAALPLLVGATSGGSNAEVTSLVCGATITTSVVLEQDLSCPGNGVVVGASGITINLNGHILSNGGASTGVVIGSFTGVTVENGTLFSFDTGVSAAGDKERIVQLVIEDPISGDGIDVTSGDGDVVSRNFVESSGDVGILFSGSSAKPTITNNRVQYSTHDGIGLVTPTDATVTGNVVLDNGWVGIRFLAGTGTVSGNVADSNGSGGIAAGAPPGEPLTLTIAGNRAAFNGDVGLFISGAKDGGRDVVQDNANALQCKGIVCAEVPS